MKLTYKENTSSKGNIYLHQSISLNAAGHREVLLYEYETDGINPREFFYGNEEDVVAAMKEALLDVFSHCSYDPDSIIKPYEDVKEFAKTLGCEWLQVVAYGLALENRDWYVVYDDSRRTKRRVK